MAVFDVPVPALSRSAHDRAAHRRDDELWLDERWPTARVLLLGPDGRASAHQDGDTVVLDWYSARDLDTPRAESTFLGVHGEIAYFSVAVPYAEPGWVNLRDVGGRLSDLDAGLLTAAVGLSAWHAVNRFSAHDGTAMQSASAGWARRSAEGHLEFPRTDPAVIMLVHDGGERCVLGRGPQWPEGRMSILAGFVEAGESAEAAVVREVGEEVGLTVTDVRYVASQPWPFPRSLMLGFTARVVGDQTIRLQEDELAEAGWFSKDEIRQAAEWGADEPDAFGWAPEASQGARLRALPGPVSIARQILDAWLAAEPVAAEA